MAAGSVMHTFEVEIADTDRGVYASVPVRAALHPSETTEFLITRVLAYCLEYEEGIEFGGGVSTREDPAVLVRDLTGALVAWIEVGAPDAARVHAGSKAAERAVVYTHRDPAKVLAAWSGKPIFRASELRLQSFDPGFIGEVAGALERRNTVELSRVESMLYLTLNGASFSSAVHEHRGAEG